MSLGWKAWSAGLAASAAIHAALAVNLAVPQSVDTGAAGPPATISGSLASILGGVTQANAVRPEAVRSAPAETAQPAAPRPVEAVAARWRQAEPLRPRVIERLEPTAPPASADAVRSVPVRPGLAVTASVAPVLPEVATPATSAAPDGEAEAGTAVRLPVKRPAVEPRGRARPQVRPPDSRAMRQSGGRQVGDKSRDAAARRRPEAPASRSGSERAGAAGAVRGGGRHAAGARAGAVRSYGAMVRARILANRPASGGIGRAVVTFGLSSAGRLSYARLARSSGNAALDRAALAAVRRSSPFPSPPAGATVRQLRFTISFDFR